MYIRFLKLNPHCALFILQQALYNSHSKKILPCEFRTLDISLHFYAPIFLWIFPPIYLDPDPLTIGFINTVIYFNTFKQHNIPI